MTKTKTVILLPIALLLALLVFTSVLPIVNAAAPPQKYQVEVKVEEVNLIDFGSIRAEFTYRNVSQFTFEAYTVDPYAAQYFTPLYAAREPLDISEMRKINVYAKQNVSSNFTLCNKSYISYETGNLTIEDFGLCCGNPLNDIFQLKFAYQTYH